MRWDRSKGTPEPVALLDRIPLFESGEPLVDLRAVAPELIIHRPQAIPFLRESAAEKVAAAAKLLPPGYNLAVTDAWRPMKRQILIYEFMTRSAREAYPHRLGPSLARTVNRWVAPPGRKAPPGHCTGGAVDLILVDDGGEQIDVTSPFDRIAGGPTHVFGLTPEAKRNRMLLVDAMAEVGMSNCRDEWWHYSYGDAGWAVRLGYDRCIYGLIDLEEELYREQQALWEESLRDRPNPFLPS